MSEELNIFTRFVADYQQRFIYFANSYVRDEAAAEDIVMDSMMYYWENRERLPKDVDIPAYVLTALKHRCIDYLRHKQVIRETSEELSQLYSWELSTRINSLEDFDPYSLFTTEIQEIVQRTLATLPEQTQRIFLMSRYKNKSHKEIAEQLGITVKGVEFHISKATKVLRCALRDYLPVSVLALYFS